MIDWSPRGVGAHYQVAIALRNLETGMKYLFALIAFSCIALSAYAALEAGESAPPFEARASLAGGEFDFRLSDALDEGTVVVYFYPSAYTRGCNIQAHEFSVKMDQFTAAGASVIGVSLDDIQRLNEFSADPEYCAGNLAVASDESGDIARSYGLDVRDAREGAEDTRGVAITHGFAERVTFIVTPDGKIAETIGGMSPMENVQKSLEAVQGRTVDASGKKATALDAVPEEVMAVARAAQPEMNFTQAEHETRNGKDYYDVGGTMPDGSEYELDMTRIDGAWTVVELQRDIGMDLLPAGVADTLSKKVPGWTPNRIIEADQGDGVIVYELFGKTEDGEDTKIEIKWAQGQAELLVDEWVH